MNLPEYVNTCMLLEPVLLRETSNNDDGSVSSLESLFSLEAEDEVLVESPRVDRITPAPTSQRAFSCSPVWRNRPRRSKSLRCNHYSGSLDAARVHHSPNSLMGMVQEHNHQKLSKEEFRRTRRPKKAELRRTRTEGSNGSHSRWGDEEDKSHHCTCRPQCPQRQPSNNSFLSGASSTISIQKLCKVAIEAALEMADDMDDQDNHDNTANLPNHNDCIHSNTTVIGEDKKEPKISIFRERSTANSKQRKRPSRRRTTATCGDGPRKPVRQHSGNNSIRSSCNCSCQQRRRNTFVGVPVVAKRTTSTTMECMPRKPMRQNSNCGCASSN